MKTKFLPLIALAGILATTACDDADNPNHGPNPDTKPAATLDIAYQAVTNNTLTIEDIAASGDDIEITVSSNRAWTMTALSTEDREWLTVTPTSGTAGTTPTTVTITVDANELTTVRDVDLIFNTTAEGTEDVITRTVTLEQSAAEPVAPTLDITYGGTVNNTLTIGDVSAEGDQYTISVSSNRAWTMEDVDFGQNEAWVIVSPANGAADQSTQVTITFAANEVEDTRSIALEFSTDDGALTRTVNFTQDAAEPTSDLETIFTSASAEYLGPSSDVPGSGEFNITFQNADTGLKFVPSSVLCPMDGSPAIAAGTYTANGNWERTFSWAYDEFTTEFGTGTFSTDGQFVVEKISATDFRVTFDVTMAWQQYHLYGIYEGPIAITGGI